MRNLVRVCVCLALGSFFVAQAEPAGESGESVTALLREARQATALIIRSARSDAALDPKIAKNKPFWISIRLIVKALVLADTGLAAKNEDFFKGIAAASVAEEQMKVAWQLTDSDSSQIISNGRRLERTLRALRTNYSKEAERAKHGGELTAPETALFSKIKAQQSELLGKIKQVESASNKDQALAKGLAEIKADAQQIGRQSTNVEGFVATLFLLDRQTGLIRGYSNFVNAEWRKDYLALLNCTKKYESLYLEWQTSAGSDWAFVRKPMEPASPREPISDTEIRFENGFVEDRSFEMTEAEQDKVALDEDSAEIVASAEDYSAEEAADDEGEEMTDDADSNTNNTDDEGGG